MIVDSKVSPSMVIIHIKQSKIDTAREGIQVVFGLTGKDVCPVKATWCAGAQSQALFYYRR